MLVFILLGSFRSDVQPSQRFTGARYARDKAYRLSTFRLRSVDNRRNLIGRRLQVFRARV